MKVDVLVFGMLRDHLPEGTSGNRVSAEVPEGATVEEIVTSLGMPRLAVYAVLVDGERADGSVVVAEGSEVTLMPPFTGGARP